MSMAGRMSDRYAIGPAVDGDRNFVADSWRRSLQDAPAYASIPTRGYVAWANGFIRHFLGDGALALADSDRLYVARDKVRPTYLYGWLLWRDTQPGLAVVYVYTKGPHRHEGVAKDLLATALEASSEGPLSYAFRTRFDGWFEDLGLAFVPVEQLAFGKREAS